MILVGIPKTKAESLQGFEKENEQNDGPLNVTDLAGGVIGLQAALLSAPNFGRCDIFAIFSSK